MHFHGWYLYLLLEKRLQQLHVISQLVEEVVSVQAATIEVDAESIFNTEFFIVTINDEMELVMVPLLKVFECADKDTTLNIELQKFRSIS